MCRTDNIGIGVVLTGRILVKPETKKIRECASYILECVAQKRPVTASKLFAPRHFQKAYLLLRHEGLIRRLYDDVLKWQLSPRGSEHIKIHGFRLYADWEKALQTA